MKSESARDVAAVQGLWSEYWRSLGLSLDFQDFAEELRALLGRYAPPAGRLLLVRINGQPAGTAAFRPLSQDGCEAKRLYVRPAYRRRGIGFVEVGPYSDNPTPGAIYLRLSL